MRGPRVSKVGRGLALGLFLASVLTPAAIAAPPGVALHQLHWLIHEDMVTPSKPLATYWEPLIEQTSRDAEVLIKGGQGPFDTPCCIGIEVASVSTFSDPPASDLLTIDSMSEFNQLSSIGGSSIARVFLVQAITDCAGTTDPIGCADTFTCGFEAPGRKAVLSFEGYEEFGVLGQVLAHEIGHTTCLTHVANDSCELMAASSGGGCLSSVATNECAEMVEDAQTTQGVCECYSDVNTLASDGTSCSSVSGGMCSGGVCGLPDSDAGVTLYASVDPNTVIGGTPNRGAEISGAPGEWSEIGLFTANRDLQGMAYSPGRDVLYGVAPDGGDDEILVTIDRATAATTTVGTITGLQSNTTVTGLAWDPGATASPTDDRLLAVDLRASDNATGSLYSIDPDTGAATFLGPVTSGGGGGWSGLAYDPVNQHLYASVAFSGHSATATQFSGLYRISTNCNPFCVSAEVHDPDIIGSTLKFDGALAYDANSHRIFHIGRQFSRTEYDSYDADDLALDVVTQIGTRGLDAFAVGGLAAIPEPEAALGSLVALGVVCGLARRRCQTSRISAA